MSHSAVKPRCALFITSLMAVGLLLFLAGCSSANPSITPGKTTTNTPVINTPTKNTSTTPVKTAKPAENTPVSWKTFSSEKYGFSLQYPPEFEKSEQNLENGVDAFFFSKGKDESYVAILPKGEFDKGLPSDNPTTRNETIGGKSFTVREWKLLDNQWLIVYDLMDSVPGWKMCGKDLMSCNRIELFAKNKEDLGELQKMMEGLRVGK